MPTPCRRRLRGERPRRLIAHRLVVKLRCFFSVWRERENPFEDGARSGHVQCGGDDEAAPPAAQLRVHKPCESSVANRVEGPRVLKSRRGRGLLLGAALCVRAGGEVRAFSQAGRATGRHRGRSGTLRSQPPRRWRSRPRCAALAGEWCREIARGKRTPRHRA